MLRIMIAVDGSEPSLDAVRHGVKLVRQGLHASLVLAHVQQEASLFELATQDPDLIARASVAAGRHLMESAVALVEAAGVSYETEVGSVSREIARLSNVPVTIVKHPDPADVADAQDVADDE